ncbi:uncharacterized protein [Physcomitrium patens]|uniref:RING-CH-type domain-containing protein n=1 Tax=Physcomitrium patens TaxID=3218 RepID=A0A2K1ISD8_PHYPA|nr:uncharacterized protein LOC112273848 [Physcomitrium patens]XP_024358611.1 uncharacterized protein LOC112273848 [Physcomitrium patens]PNR32191.1 hypothetical protein PHYPA_026317 [Physcomitrium patens]|eukprot:XP_024358610.1 uncharacterized protein LOC112273848 [Physcomitrella patens]
MDSQNVLADQVKGNRNQLQGSGEIILTASSEIAVSSVTSPSVPAPSCPEVVNKPTACSSHLPPLSATKSGKNSTAHGQVPRPHLRSRVSLEKNKFNIILTGTPVLQPTSEIPPTPYSDKRASSLPVPRANAHSSGSNSESVKGHSHELAINVLGHEKVNPIIRSFSTPVIGDKVDSACRDGKGYMLVRSASPQPSSVQQSRENESGDAVHPHVSSEFDVEKGKGSIKDELEEAIPVEEAVCRICMDSLTEDCGETLKMECRCLGEMALAHKECAFKWFGIKGDRVCDVCGTVVQNIPVTMVRVPANEQTVNQSRSVDTHTVNRTSIWQDIPVLAIINMMAYFCFIEQLLVSKLGTKALAISIPFSIIIGLLASVTTIALVTKRYVWMYATIQFALVCIFGYVFFFKTKLETVLAVLLAAFSGFGVAMTSNALILEYVHWKTYTSRRTQQAASVVDVEVSFRQENISGELAPANSQWSRELNTSQVSSVLDIGSDSATARSPSSRSQAPSETHSMHCS